MPDLVSDPSALAGLREALESQLRDWSPVQAFDPAHPRVRLHEPSYGVEEVWEALRCLVEARITMGETVRAFEQAFAARHASPHGIMVNSGSSANLLALAALTNPAWPQRLQPGDEVIVPALSWSTTVWPVIQQGLVPVLVDIDPHTLNVDPEQVERAIGPRTRAVMLVHVYGNPCDMDALMPVIDAHGLTLIEDGCEAMGASFNDQPVGTYGTIGTFSTYYSHHITTLEGGLCVTADAALAELCRVLRAHGWVREVQRPEAYLQANPDIDPRFLFVNLGYNLRATEPQAAIGLEQLKRLDGFLTVRAQNAGYWRQALGAFGHVFGFQEVTPRGASSWFGFPMWVRPEAPFTAQDVRAHLESRGIETRPIIAGNMAAQPGLKLYPHRVVGDLRRANAIMRQGFTFGNHQHITPEAREYVTGAVREFVAAKGAA